MIRRPPRSTHCISSAASDVYKRQDIENLDAVRNTCEKLVKSLNEDNATQNDFEALYSKISCPEIIRFKNEVMKISGDMNLHCIAESLLLATIIENQRLVLDSLNKSQPNLTKSCTLNDIEEKVTKLTEVLREGNVSMVAKNMEESNKKANELKDLVEKTLSEEIRTAKEELKNSCRKEKESKEVEQMKEMIEQLEGKYAKYKKKYKNCKDKLEALEKQKKSKQAIKKESHTIEEGSDT
eukprot:TRINITY_DN7678_c0_g1_i7.p1 TRINITY_DN7678_c0_g1~~TRINITY_DN7678_c0_g1_i7.p1  ORF type:complete len:248 (+),score=87.20 TRINITY_DN7678_c0_g1_i7:30-746(+)